MKAVLFCLIVPVYLSAQWPGYFYSFTLTDASSKKISTNTNGFLFSPVKSANSDIILKVMMCDDSTTIRFYIGGYHGLDDVHELEIVDNISKEKMIIKFPSSLSGGEDKFYRNLYAGNFVFKNTDYIIKLPATDAAWNALKEKHFCVDYGGNDSYWDISAFQNE